MDALRIYTTIEQDGELRLSNLPLKRGQRVELVVRPESEPIERPLLTAEQLLASSLVGLWADRDDLDETVYATQFFGRLVEGRPDGFNDAKEGVIGAFTVEDALSGSVAVREITLQPLDSGFAADRRQYCLDTRQALQQAGNTKFFNSGVDGAGDGAAQLANETFCPDVNSQDVSDTGPIANVPQKAYPNQLYAALIRGPDLYLPNIAASPEPPVKFNVNIQAMVGVIDVYTGQDRSVNLNAQIKAETRLIFTQINAAR